MFKSLRSRILLVVCGVVFLTTGAIALFSQRVTEVALSREVNQHAHNLVAAVLLNVEIEYQSLVFHQEEMLEWRKREIKDIVSMACARIEESFRNYRQGRLSQEEAQRTVLAELRMLRYDEGKGYLFIFNMDIPWPRVILQPIAPGEEGTTPDDPRYYTVLGSGKHLLVAMADVCRKDGEGFVDYQWIKPGKTELLPPRNPRYHRCVCSENGAG